MSSASPDAPSHLGGRLPLLAPEELDDDQRLLHQMVSRRVGGEAEAGGFTVQLDDGRLIGPFNALLRVPAIAAAMGAWTAQIEGFGLDEDVRQVVILTVGAHWSAEFEVDAHAAAARAASVSDEAADAIVRRETPLGLCPRAAVAQRFTAVLLATGAVPDAVYQAALELFGEAAVVALLCLIGQYQTISGILVTFEVPSPSPAPR